MAGIWMSILAFIMSPPTFMYLRAVENSLRIFMNVLVRTPPTLRESVLSTYARPLVLKRSPISNRLAGIPAVLPPISSTL